MDFNRFTEKLQEAFRAAQSLAAGFGNQQIDVEHLLVALLEQDGGLAQSILARALAQGNVKLEDVHRRLIQADEPPPVVGFQMEQQIHLRGVSLRVHWTLVECRRAKLAVWEGRGPARSRARTEYVLTPEDGGTRFDYRNEFHPPLGPLGAIVSRALVRGMPEREAKRTLERLRSYLETNS